MEQEKPRIYAVVNQKGGVGKSVTSTNLGIGLARKGQKVLIVDLDSQASQTVSLGWKQPDELPVTIATQLKKVVERKPFDPAEGILHHNTAAATAVKVVTGLPSGYKPSAGDFLFLNYQLGTNNSATSIQLSIGGTAYPVWFNGMVTNAVTGVWHVGGIIPFYFDGTRFHQLFYPKYTDDDTTYTGFFEQPLTGVRLPINPDRDVINYHLVLERGDGTFDRPLTNTSNVTTTAKPVNTAAVFKVDGLIFANAVNNQPKGSVMGGTVNTLIQTRQTSMLISYAMNGSAGLAQYSWVYLVGIPQDDPMLYQLDPASATSWYTTTKPTAEDGKVYIRLGYYETSTNFSLFSDHPAYWFKDGYFRPYLTRGAV